MSIIRALQDYLMDFDGMELRTIHTDGTESEAGTCAIAPAGNSKTVEDIIGNRSYLNNYVLDAFFEWLEDNNDNEVYPVISGYTVEGISAANVLLFDVDEAGRGTYQIQIQLRLTKRSV